MTQSGYHICEVNCVFICSPFKGDVKANIENAKKYARFAALKGNAVFVPHLFYPQFGEGMEHRLARHLFSETYLYRTS